jgi:hypothetical protein
MEIEGEKKRKIEEEQQEVINLEDVLKELMAAQQNLCKLLGLMAQKLVGLEKVFNKDLFKSS